MRRAGDDIEILRRKVQTLQGQSVCVKINPGRNKISFLTGMIKDVYHSLFTICGEDNVTKSFSYSDVLCGRLVFVRRISAEG